jgi:hypothetical protein
MGLKEYAKYIVNTGQSPLDAAMFDDDWEPIGPMVRADMERAGLIEQSMGALMLTDAGEALASS